MYDVALLSDPDALTSATQRQGQSNSVLQHSDKATSVVSAILPLKKFVCPQFLRRMCLYDSHSRVL